MVIINRTPDSFYDTGRTLALDAAIDASMPHWQKARTGWTSAGSRSHQGLPKTREEADRVIPVITGVRQRSNTIISTDTFNPEVAQLSIKAGANAINDTSGLRNPDTGCGRRRIRGAPGHHPQPGSAAASPGAPVR